MANEVWVIEHSGREKYEWFIWDSTPNLSQLDATVRAQELGRTHKAILRFRVTKYVPESTEGGG